jgi:peptidoglycan/LPS O-acetylase OafA/YrhL
MLGSFRFFLALCVVVYHLSAAIPAIGQLAVECFYTISGYLMTLVLNENYRFKLLPFAENRFLRLYPSYYALILLTLCAWGAWPGTAPFHSAWNWNYDNANHISDCLANLLIFPWSLPIGIHSPFRVLPPTWSVAVEIACYALLWLFVSRRWWTATITICAAAVWHAYTFEQGMGENARYFPVSSSMLAFSLGSLTYRIALRVEQARPEWLSKNVAQIAFLGLGITAFLLNWGANIRHGDFSSNAYFYFDMVIASLACLSFHRIRVNGVLGSIDRWLGDLSYPIFLGQFTAGYITWRLMGSPAAMRGWDITIGAICLSICFGIACVVLIDRPLQRLRGKVRRAAQRTCRLSGQASKSVPR